MSATTTTLGTPAPRRRKGAAGKPPGRRGRKPLSPAEKCSKTRLLRLRPADDEQIVTAARMLGESVAEFIATASLRRAEQTGSDNRDISKYGQGGDRP